MPIERSIEVSIKMDTNFINLLTQQISISDKENIVTLLLSFTNFFLNLVICGEWQTGDIPRNSSVEDYNIILEIESITRHPDYRVNFEPSFLINDIAVFKVNDGPLAPVSTKKKVRSPPFA